MPLTTRDTSTRVPSDSGRAGHPPTCEIRDWVVFGPGYHKEDLYTPADCQRMAELFQRLSTGPSPLIEPVGKLGHDWEERARNSLGLPSFGRISNLETDSSGRVHIWMKEIPRLLGSAIKSRLIRKGSIEVPPPLPDPHDPAKKLHPVCTGVAFLGEEQPAVKMEEKIPDPVFEDGSPVPPCSDDEVKIWLQVMASVMQAFAASSNRRSGRTFAFAGRTYTAVPICFSDLTPLKGEVMRDQLLEALKAKGIPVDDPEVQAKSDEELQAMLDDYGTMSFGAFSHKHFAAPPPPPSGAAGAGAAGGAAGGGGAAGAGGGGEAPPAYFTAFADEMKKCMGDLTGRIGAVEAKAGDDQKKKEEAAFSVAAGRVDEVLKRNRTKMTPAAFKDLGVRETGIDILTKRTFAAETDRTKAFSDWASSLDRMPDHPACASFIQDQGAGGGSGAKPLTSPVVSEMVRPGGFLDRNAPGATKVIRDAAAAA